jgi:oxygen tolerance protein BatD
MRDLFFWCALALAAAPAAGQAPVQAKPDDGVTVSARLSAGVMRLGDSGTLTVTVENAEGARILQVPTVPGLRFGNPSDAHRSSFSAYINGVSVVERTLSFAIPFRAEAEGDHEIPAVTVGVAGTRYETKPVRVTVVKDISGADFGFLEVRPSGTRVVEGQPFTLELLCGWDEVRTGKVSFAELNLPWWDSLPGAIEVEGAPVPQASRVDIPVSGSQPAPAEQIGNTQRGGRSFITLRLTKSYLPTRSGTLEFPTSFFEFGRVRQTSFFDARRESHFVQTEAFAVEVVPLPSEGQPLDFSGAVGAFQVRAAADTRDVRAGDSIKLTVEWTGQGNLEYFRVPDPSALESFRGFRVYGSAEEKSFERRKVVYDLAPLSAEVQTIPAVPLSAFDPEKGRYEIIASAPIPIRVRALEKGAGLADDERRFERDIEDIDARAPELAPARGAHGQDLFLAGALVAVPLVGLLARAQARRRAGDPGAPLERRRRRAPRELARALTRAADAPARQAAVLEFLAARTREAPAAWAGRDFAPWAAERLPALPEAERRETSAALGALEAAVWGGGAAPDPARLQALARRLTEVGL